MPALPPVPNVVRVQYVMTVGPNPDVMTNLHLLYSGPAASQPQATQFAADCRQAFVNGPILSMVATNILTKTVTTDLSTNTSFQGVFAGSDAGTSGGLKLPASTSVLVNWLVQARYRGGKPRNYFPMGADADLQDASHWLPASVTNFTTRINTLINYIQSHMWSGASLTGVCAVSYYKGFKVVTDPVTGRARNVNTLRATPLVLTTNGFQVSSYVGTQRRRIRGTGN
jgi:hypothetical protein